MLKKTSLTKADIVLIIFLLLISILSLGILSWDGDKAEGKRVSVQIDGREVDSLDLSGTNIGKSFKYKSKYGSNIIHLSEDGVCMEKSDCSKQICVHQGEIRKIGSMIVCLPNHLLIEIKSSDNKAGDIDAIIR